MPNNKGTPLIGDRSAWDDANFPDEHSKDIADGIAVHHLPDGATDGQVAVWDEANSKWIPADQSGGGASAFTDLTDVPASYTGQAGKVAAVKATEDGLEFVAAGGGASAFTDLTDTFAAYTGLAGKYVKVKSTEDGLETGTPSAGIGSGGDLYAYVDGTLVISTNVDWFVAPRTCTIEKVIITCQDPGSAGSTIVDVHKNGTTIFTTTANRPTLAYTDTTADGIPDITSLVEDDVLSIDIDQVATGAAGLSVTIAIALSGSFINTGAYASMPTAALDGKLYLPSDGLSLQRDTGAAWIPWGPIFPFTQPPAAANWTWLNQGAASVADSKGALYLLSTADTASNNYHILHKAQPTKPYVITAAFVTNMSTGAYNTVGIGWLDSATGKFIIFGTVYDGHINVTKYTNYSTWSAGYLTTYTPVNKPLVTWLKIEDNNTNRICSVSFDGVNFLQLHSIGNTDFLTADKVFFGLNSNNVWSTGMTLLSWKEA